VRATFAAKKSRPWLLANSGAVSRTERSYICRRAGSRQKWNCSFLEGRRTMSRFIPALLIGLLIACPLRAEQESGNLSAAPKQAIIDSQSDSSSPPSRSEPLMIRLAGSRSVLGLRLQSTKPHRVCLQLPVKCSSNSDCTCSKCCSSWSVCQPSC
jgi:hypothetical protein